jgi:hypothetical protein
MFRQNVSERIIFVSDNRARNLNKNYNNIFSLPILITCSHYEMQLLRELHNEILLAQSVGRS